jgi:hypothetical protein
MNKISIGEHVEIVGRKKMEGLVMRGKSVGGSLKDVLKDDCRLVGLEIDWRLKT